MCHEDTFCPDFSKGFDFIDYNIHLKELRSFNIDSVQVNWIKAFLADKRQAVRIGNFLSDSKGGVSQGTKLDAILFKVMTYNLLKDWKLTIKFVDDTTALEILA